MIAIIDYGAGNLRSVQNTLDEIGASYELVREPGGLERAPKIILPGVGNDTMVGGLGDDWAYFHDPFGNGEDATGGVHLLPSLAL